MAVVLFNYLNSDIKIEIDFNCHMEYAMQSSFHFVRFGAWLFHLKIILSFNGHMELHACRLLKDFHPPLCVACNHVRFIDRKKKREPLILPNSSDLSIDTIAR